jgi:hypothetical protein
LKAAKTRKERRAKGMLSKEQRADLVAKLNKVDTPEEMLNYLVNHYDLKRPMGSIVKSTFVEGIVKAANLINAQKRL